jgi:tetratricopeptide (TPR) repeat protein
LHAEAIAAARLMGDSSVELRAEIEWTQLQIRRGDEQARTLVPELAQRADEHFTAIGDHAGIAAALLLRKSAPGMAVGDIDILREAQVHAELAGDERTQIEIWDELGGSMIFGPTPYPEILGFMQREVAWAKEHGIAFAEADGLLGQAYAIAASGQADQAREAVAAVRVLFEQVPGFVSQLGECDILAASIELDAADLLGAERLLRRAVEVLETGGHVPWWTTATLELANVLVDLGQPIEAKALLDEVDRRGLMWSARGKTLHAQARARLAATHGELDEAISLAREAVAVISESDLPQYAARAYELLAKLLTAAGDRAGATAELMRARDLYAEKAYRPGEARVEARLSTGRD